MFVRTKKRGDKTYYQVYRTERGKDVYVQSFRDKQEALDMIAKGQDITEQLKKRPDLAARISRTLREELRKGMMIKTPLPKGPFDVIYADPPWEYDNAIESWGPASLHYSTMPTEAICRLSVLRSAADNAALFLWVTNPFLADALKVVSRWGFEYKTNMVWAKTGLQRPGSGFYVRGRHEVLFICTRGSFVPDQKGKAPIGSVIEADVAEHSKKPERAYEIIEAMYPGARYLEMFHRGPVRTGWTTWPPEAEYVETQDAKTNIPA